MLKKDELQNPASCLNKSADDEMVFVLTARDTAAPDAIRTWCVLRVSKGKNTWTDAQITEALDCAEKMETQYKEIQSSVNA